MQQEVGGKRTCDRDGHVQGRKAVTARNFCWRKIPFAVERTASTRYPGITSVGYNVVRLVPASRYLFYTFYCPFYLSTLLQPTPTQLRTFHIRSSAVARRACNPNTGHEPRILTTSSNLPRQVRSDKQIDLPESGGTSPNNAMPRLISNDAGHSGHVVQYPPANKYAWANAQNAAPTFNSVAGDMITSYGESGLDILYRHVAMEALHDSGERFPEPACHPGTRTAVSAQLTAWSVDTSPESTIMWLHGSAGMGKSAIAQMFAGQCQAQGRLGASFFFRRGHPTRGSWHRLFTTIAYQLSNSTSELLLLIQQAVETDKLVVGRTLTVQFQKLLLEPFQSTPRLESMPVIVLDGLDECADHKIQEQILRLWITAIRDNQLRIRLLIISRPEPHIRRVLQTDEAFVICRHLDLPTDEAAYEDIRTYFRDEFSRIYSDYLSQAVDLGSVWPDPDALEQLVAKSSGIFIYAITVIRFIDDEYSHPVDRLTSVLNLDPKSTAPLDDLYTQILSTMPHEPQQLRILHAIWQETLEVHLAMDPEGIDMVLGLRTATCRLALRALHSLFDVPRIHAQFSFKNGSVTHGDPGTGVSQSRGYDWTSLHVSSDSCRHR
ncbi:hypothetical protein DFH08DRAFT_799711 [Mycena albidolilacea]|uniref:Nephrocystin 3-like N-terminal domain-containing protein n=1 Tax=Mycena albidolilacea TaxID=1033008 RepID=A0AAD7ANB9_9AGAR|nr:hypothetical protein DFH08DRAFT_799711 [Mycena albidolilacea]